MYNLKVEYTKKGDYDYNKMSFIYDEKIDYNNLSPREIHIIVYTSMTFFYPWFGKEMINEFTDEVMKEFFDLDSNNRNKFSICQYHDSSKNIKFTFKRIKE